MLSSFSNKAILTKARAMYGKKITVEQYKDLLKKQSVSEVAYYLKTETHYAETLSSINENTIHRGQLENLLKKDLFQRYMRLCHYDYSKDTEFYHYIVIQSESEQILDCILHIDSGSRKNFVNTMPAFLTKFASFDINKLNNLKSFEDLIKVLDNTRYKNLLNSHLSKAPGEINTTACEVALRNNFYTLVFKIIDDYYTGKTKDELKEIFEIKAGLENLNLIIRLKQFFKLNPDQIKLLLIPFGHKLSKYTIDHIVDAETIPEALSYVRMPKLAKTMADNEFLFIEDLTSRLQYYLNSQLVRYSVNAPTVLCSFMVLSEIEISNITNIIEGIRYKIPANDIEELLII